MIKETWAQFRDRVKPAEGQKFIDDRGEWWVSRNGDFVHEKNGIYLGEDGFGSILSCSLVGTIEHVESTDRCSDVDSPAHYNVGSIEVIDAIDAWGLNFCLGNAVKYIARAGHKTPDIKADLEKAIWYLLHEISKHKNTK